MKLNKTIKKLLKAFNLNEALGPQKNDFFNEIDFINHNRLLIFSIVLVIIHIPLIYIDYFRLTSNTPANLFGAQLILYAHSAILLAMTGFFFLGRKLRVKNYRQIRSYHSILLKFVLIVLFMLMQLVTIGDLLINQSIIAYMGGIFAFSVIPLLSIGFSMALYFLSSALLIFIMQFMNINPDILLNHQVNLVVFTIVAWIMSRYLFMVYVNNYLNRKEKERLIDELQEAVSNINTLSGLLPICSHCKKIRDDQGYWNQLESYIHKHSQAKFSHGICPDCAAELYPDLKNN